MQKINSIFHNGYIIYIVIAIAAYNGYLENLELKQENKLLVLKAEKLKSNYSDLVKAEKENRAQMKEVRNALGKIGVWTTLNGGD